MIQLVYKPAVYVIARQQVIREEVDTFLEDEGVPDWKTDTAVPAEEVTEIAGRLCYMSYRSPRPGGNQAYLDHIFECGHGSVIEHAVWSLLLTGVSRSLTHELVRHRAGFGYSQLSQRFVDESECRFVVPSVLADEVSLAAAYRVWAGKYILEVNPRDFWSSSAYRTFSPELDFEEFSQRLKAGDAWVTSMENAQKEYTQTTDYLLRKAPIMAATERRKWARQAARSILPNACETKIFLTGNARAFRHFLEMRGSPHAEAEIRALAVAAYHRLRVESPHLFGDYEIITCADGAQGVVSKHPKV